MISLRWDICALWAGNWLSVREMMRSWVRERRLWKGGKREVVNPVGGEEWVSSSMLLFMMGIGKVMLSCCLGALMFFVADEMLCRWQVR